MEKFETYYFDGVFYNKEDIEAMGLKEYDYYIFLEDMKYFLRIVKNMV